MKRQRDTFTRLYRKLLRTHLGDPSGTDPVSAHGLGERALAVGLPTVDLARIHEQILVEEMVPPCTEQRRATLIARGGAFLAAALIPTVPMSPDVIEVTTNLQRAIEALSQRTVELAASNLDLSREIAKRQVVEDSLKKSEAHYAKLLKQSAGLQEQLRLLSRQILSAQEEERRTISRELHDVIAQTLTGISLRLATLKQEASTNTRGLERSIDRTQRLVAKSVQIIHRFARNLRPAVLDDLGLVPALQAFLKTFTAQTGVHTKLSAGSGITPLDITRRTVLFRVAQEALTNVARHAHATQVVISLTETAKGLCLTIADDGQSFQVDTKHPSRTGKRLGLLGMRERLEMIGGRFEITSVAGIGTTVTAHLPPAKAQRPKRTTTPTTGSTPTRTGTP